MRSGDPSGQHAAGGSLGAAQLQPHRHGVRFQASLGARSPPV